MSDTNNVEQDSAEQVFTDTVVENTTSEDDSLEKSGSNNTNSARTNALQHIVEWKQQYQAQLSPSPLEDITQLAAQLELTHAHPSGIAQLFASGKVTLKSLFRDAGMLRAAGRRLDRVLKIETQKHTKVAFPNFL